MVGDEPPATRERVLAGIDADPDHPHRAAAVRQLVERALDLLDHERAVVPAQRVDPGHDDDMAAIMGERDLAAVLVGEGEVRRRDVGQRAAVEIRVGSRGGRGRGSRAGAVDHEHDHDRRHERGKHTEQPALDLGRGEHRSPNVRMP
jgi:hypothetical protein